MTRHGTFIATFAATVAIAVPAAWHFLDADIRTDGKHMRGLDRELVLGDAKVTVSVDRSLIMTGDTVAVKLAATAPTERDITLDMTVYHAKVRWGERVEPAQIPVDHETIVVHATPDGGKPRETRVTLGSKRAAAGSSEAYRVFVGGKGAKLPQDGNDGDDGEHGTAAIGILAWSGNTLPMTIQPEGTPSADQPFVVAVHVKNTHKHEIPAPYVELGTQISVYGGLTADENEDFKIERIEAETAPSDYQLPAGKELVQRFTITPLHHATKLTLAASAFAYGNEMGKPTDSAMNASTVTLTDGTPAVAVKD